MSIVSWVLINIYLLQKYFVWGGEAKQTPGELQEQIAMALINNSLYKEAMNQEQDPDDDDDPQTFNDPECCQRHPQYKQNTCTTVSNTGSSFTALNVANPKI